MYGSTEAGLAGPPRTPSLPWRQRGSSDTPVKVSERCSVRTRLTLERSGGGFVNGGASIAFWWVTPDPP